MSQKGRVERGEGTGSGDGGAEEVEAQEKHKNKTFHKKRTSWFPPQSSNKGALIGSSSDLGQVV